MGSIGRYTFRTTFGAFLVICISVTALMWITQALRVSAGFLLYVLAKITGDLSKAGMMIPAAAAGLPAAIGGITGVLALLYQEDG